MTNCPTFDFFTVSEAAGGLSTNYVGEMEHGLKAPGLPVIVRLARALDLGVNELLRGFTEANIRRLKV